MPRGLMADFVEFCRKDNNLAPMIEAYQIALKRRMENDRRKNELPKEVFEGNERELNRKILAYRTSIENGVRTLLFKFFIEGLIDELIQTLDKVKLPEEEEKGEVRKEEVPDGFKRV